MDKKLEKIFQKLEYSDRTLERTMEIAEENDQILQDLFARMDSEKKEVIYISSNNSSSNSSIYDLTSSPVEAQAFSHQSSSRSSSCSVETQQSTETLTFPRPQRDNKTVKQNEAVAILDKLNKNKHKLTGSDLFELFGEATTVLVQGIFVSKKRQLPRWYKFPKSEKNRLVKIISKIVLDYFSIDLSRFENDWFVLFLIKQAYETERRESHT
ncbi:uncharacterized protein EV154DRAFT_565244 [Mucor mucedo]|uniref:uncharacterized protein n=1 Tax=Mucor mucedo TaxID=29922 RepID=UPI00221E56F6|nr:uncharacterized protein EV154DRAFT_565244 [Mucor mucedo]KAI7889550.1 hypothetical protein EV154DRAFT_565244 [Mucor mucedo]